MGMKRMKNVVLIKSNLIICIARISHWLKLVDEISLMEMVCLVGNAWYQALRRNKK